MFMGGITVQALNNEWRKFLFRRPYDLLILASNRRYVVKKGIYYMPSFLYCLILLLKYWHHVYRLYSLLLRKLLLNKPYTSVLVKYMVQMLTYLCEHQSLKIDKFFEGGR